MQLPQRRAAFKGGINALCIVVIDFYNLTTHGSLWKFAVTKSLKIFKLLVIFTKNLCSWTRSGNGSRGGGCRSCCNGRIKNCSRITFIFIMGRAPWIYKSCASGSIINNKAIQIAPKNTYARYRSITFQICTSQGGARKNALSPMVVTPLPMVRLVAQGDSGLKRFKILFAMRHAAVANTIEKVYC